MALPVPDDALPHKWRHGEVEERRKSVVRFVVLRHLFEGGVLCDGLDQTRVQGLVEEGGHASDHGADVLLQLFVLDEQEVGVVLFLPPAQVEVEPISEHQSLLVEQLQEVVHGARFWEVVIDHGFVHVIVGYDVILQISHDNNHFGVVLCNGVFEDFVLQMCLQLTRSVHLFSELDSLQ